MTHPTELSPLENWAAAVKDEKAIEDAIQDIEEKLKPLADLTKEMSPVIREHREALAQLEQVRAKIQSAYNAMREAVLS